MNNKEIKSGMSCDRNCEDDISSNYSENSQQSAAVDVTNQVEEEPPIRVRDMINLYNFATQKNQELAHAKSVYFGSNMKTTQQMEEQECCEGTCHKLQANDAPASTSRPQTRKQQTSFRITSSEDRTSVHQSPLTDAAGGESIEKSYQSKTTIRRTEQGVRIIIDIFFDKSDTDIDIVGSRVETDIPESHILADFQQHSLAMQSQKLKQKPTV